MGLINALNSVLFAETTANVNFGFDGVSVFNNMMSVISGNIAPILALMGLMLGAGWVIKYFKRARKGSI